MRAVLVTPPGEEPITLEEAKAQCRVTHSAEDDLIDAYVTAARQYAEEYTRRAFILQTWRVTLDAFPCRSSSRLILPRPPLIEVTEVAYTDGYGVDQVLADFWTDPDPITPGMLPLYGAEWPMVWDFSGSVRVTYKAGYGGIDDVPQAIKSAIRLMVGHLYNTREGIVIGTIASKVPMGVEALLNPYRVLSAA